MKPYRVQERGNDRGSRRQIITRRYLSGLGSIVSVILCTATSSFAQINIATANYDNQRTNANLQEQTLNTSNVNPDSFGRVGAFPVDGQIYAQPLYISGVPTAANGTKNVVFVVTMHNSVYALDADAPQSNTPLWRVNLGPSVPAAMLGVTDLLPEVGILGTPVIDPAAQVMYVVADSYEDGQPVFRLHALSLADGREVLNGPVVISATVNGGTNAPGANSDGTLSFHASSHLQRPGLALSNGVVSLAFGSHGDSGTFHGWMMGYDASDLQHQVAVLNTSLNGNGGSVWQSGRAPAIGSDGTLFVVTGNGDYDGVSNFGESALRLSGSNLSILDWYTPPSWSDWNGKDWDFGSTGAMLIPSTGQILAGGKSGFLYIIQPDNMGRIDPNAATQSVPLNVYGIYDFALWDGDAGTIVYLLEPGGPLKALQITNGAINPVLLSQNSPATISRSAGIAVSAQSGVPGSAIVWETAGDILSFQIPGTLHAYDARDLSIELWNSGIVPDRDSLGRFSKFVAPTVANGRVYVPTLSNQLAIYGLLDSGMPSTDPPQITAVANAASYGQDAVSPGTVVAIFGSNLGPNPLMPLLVDDNGHLTKTLGGTQVLFDGVPAPLVYTSVNQLGAVVPFGVTGPNTSIQVLYQNQASPTFSMPVQDATPAIFTVDGSGGGQAAILNQDGTLNSVDQPADKGSTIVLFITGAGQTTPGGDDGKVTTANGPLPTPILPVYVIIDNQIAQLVYAGAAPGMVQGVTQINAVVPDNVSSGQYIQITVYVGDYSSPGNVNLVIR